MRPEDFDFELPEQQIAQRPADNRGDSRMLVLLNGERQATHSRELQRYLADALVVVNESKVVPARVMAKRLDGREFELLICEPKAASQGMQISAWVRGAKKLKQGDQLAIGDLHLRYLEADSVDPRARLFEIESGELMSALEGEGSVPLPPYIARPGGPSAEDVARYQTVYAQQPGSVAAPTAGLHFAPEQLQSLKVARITLHVGPGTFLPMESEDVHEHRVGSERYEVGEEAAELIAEAQLEGRPIVAVGTTVTRVLETLALRNSGKVPPGSGATDLVITPAHKFQVVERLLTNFHLPRSSLLMLTCSFGGRERVLSAYRYAVEQGFRFYSYGDCMLIDRGE